MHRKLKLFFCPSFRFSAALDFKVLLVLDLNRTASVYRTLKPFLNLPVLLSPATLDLRVLLALDQKLTVSMHCERKPCVLLSDAS
mmetsp:Transcript_16731/g.43204  ORF Transcript_16731/g.43204 Transcript_16731/m.43204 type:complete len:85 (+) Transcript_16731:63-317(+)